MIKLISVVAYFTTLMAPAIPTPVAVNPETSDYEWVTCQQSRDESDGTRTVVTGRANTLLRGDAGARKKACDRARAALDAVPAR